MKALLVGFDSAWSQSNRGAMVGVLLRDDGAIRELGVPQSVNFADAADIVSNWQQTYSPLKTLILLDQPTIVQNATGQRPVESIASSVVSRRRGGMQPANTQKAEMFGPSAPVWTFIARFGGAAIAPAFDQPINVIETYPVLTMISLDWMLPDNRPHGRLPKYNPERRRTFNIGDWVHVCTHAATELRKDGLTIIPAWLETIALLEQPTKRNQDGLDACLCLLVALHLAHGRNCLLIGNQQSGYIVVPDSSVLRAELQGRCFNNPEEWMRVITHLRQQAEVIRCLD